MSFFVYVTNENTVLVQNENYNWKGKQFVMDTVTILVEYRTQGNSNKYYSKITRKVLCLNQAKVKQRIIEVKNKAIS